jgi:tRNA dimethylallyltransferase
MRLSDVSDADSELTLTDVAVICGPTAAGKTAIALWLAERVPVTIVSADSRQIYREFDIGTAKPTRGERARVPHLGVDIVDPVERYSAARWADAAGAWIEDARNANRSPVVVGGTGLYLRALFDGLFHEPVLDPRRRAELSDVLGGFSSDELRRWVQVLDPSRAHFGRTQLLRAVEIALLAGQRVSELHRNRPRDSRWRPHYLLVDPGLGLAARIAGRIDAMLEQGWPEEVERLKHTVAPEAPAWNATGYDAVRRLVNGTQSSGVTREEILIGTRQYAKRQRTWFRHQLSAERVTVLDPASPNWAESVERWYAGIPRCDEMNA